jgi:hypothetical protein
VLESYIADAAAVAWRPGETEGIVFRGQILLSGEEGGPEAFRFRFEPCLAVYAHMHLVSQFQLLIGGRMDLPRATMRLRPVAVHYTDHARPYGPFSVDDGHDVLVLHPRKGGLVPMADKAARREINLGGREFSGMEKDAEWKAMPDHVRIKVLIPSACGPEALMIDLEPGASLPEKTAAHGRYEVVLRGSMIFDGAIIEPPGLRFVRGDIRPSPAVAGPAGATVAMLAYDDDASKGGLAGDRLSRDAEAAMSRAI